MRITLVSSAVDGGHDKQNATSFVIDDTVAIDAGSLGFWREPEDQARIKNLFLTHSHADHVATLPIFVENAFEQKPDCVKVWGNAHVLRCIREDIFNDRLWPDFVELSTPEAPYLELRELHAEEPVEVDGLRLTPVLVNHQVRNFGFVIESEDGAVVIVSDTGPTERIWELVNGLEDLRAVFLETAFPNGQRELADVSRHLTPELFAREVKKIERETRLIVVHLKPRYRREIEAELMALGIPGLEIGRPAEEYVF
ncbi:MAG: 3',5'-cyclic-nucleotide phosphodiesterase [Planctomycetota bacterium]|nr:3',5'-cyclic-nucleotide phosphodiesterase [Planctomycetota bacterium]